MNATSAVLIALGLVAVQVSVLYWFSIVRWEFCSDVLVLRWILFGLITIRRRRIDSVDVLDVEPFVWRRHWKAPLEFFGKNLPPGKGQVVVRLRSGFVRGIVFIPERPEALLREVHTRIRPK